VRDLEVTKCGSCQHFRDRPNLLKLMPTFWIDECTESVRIRWKANYSNGAAFW